VRKNYLIPIIVVVGIFVLAGGVFFGLNLIKSGDSNKSNSLSNKPAKQAMQEIVDLNIKRQFIPENIQVVLEDKDLVRYGFGRKYADNYKAEWRKNGSYFLTFAGYQKNQNKDFVGYTINIHTKGNNLKGLSAAQLFLKNMPATGWKSAPPNSLSDVTSEVSTIIWKEGSNKIYLEVLSLSYKELKYNETLGENIKDLTIIRKLLYTPNNPDYGIVDEFQSAALKLFSP